MKKLFIFMVCVFLSVSSAQEIERYIDVTGNAEITVPADHIYFVIQIKTVEETLEKSRAENVKTSDELAGIFNDFSILKDDWQLSPIRFGKEYSYTREERKLIGYFSMVDVTVKLKNFDKYYDFISRLSTNPLFEIVRSDYGLAEFQKYHKEATVKAAQAAKDKAEYLAASLQVKTGKIIQISELNQFDPVPMRLNNTIAVMDGGGNTEISGEIKIVRTINLKIEIVD